MEVFIHEREGVQDSAGNCTGQHRCKYVMLLVGLHM